MAKAKVEREIIKILSLHLFKKNVYNYKKELYLKYI